MDENTPKDFLNQELKIGDPVVFEQKHYRNFWTGRIIKITPKMIFIEHKRANIGGTQTKQAHSQVIKITEEQFENAEKETHKI